MLSHFHPEHLLHFLQLSRVGSGDIVVLRPVLADVIELPFEVVGGILNGCSQQLPGRPNRDSAQHPAIVVQPPHAHYLEVLAACV